MVDGLTCVVVCDVVHMVVDGLTCVAMCDVVHMVMDDLTCVVMCEQLFTGWWMVSPLWLCMNTCSQGDG